MIITAKPAGHMAHAEGVIKALDTKAGTVTLAHGPVQELKWPAMTMAFKLVKTELAKGLAVGEKVQFEFQAHGMAAVITSIRSSAEPIEAVLDNGMKIVVQRDERAPVAVSQLRQEI